MTALAAAFALPTSVQAFEIETGTEIKLRWDNTLKYTAAWRVAAPNAWVANQNGAQATTDFGDLSFKKGLINNRIDLLSELDFAYRDVGFRVSGAAWYDAEYARGSNDFPAAPGGLPNYQAAFPAALGGGANNRLSSEAKKIMGRYGEIADAFVFGKFDLGEQTLALRAGKHTLIYGESLFLGANGIAAAQGPVDAIKALSLPNVQFKEIAMPVGQLSGSLSLSPAVTVGGYYQYQWREHRIPAVGSYFSPADIVGAGADLAIHPFSAATGGPFALATPFAVRGNDLKGRNAGHWGAQVKFKVGDVDYGLYAARYDDKNPIPVLNVASVAAGTGSLGGGVYNVAYARNIKVYGASFSTVVGETNIAGEISTRRNVPLTAPGDLILATNFANPNYDNDSNTPYARGNSLHLNLSAISLLPGNGIWGSASLIGEFAFNRLLDVSYRPTFTAGFPDPLNTTHTRDASAMRVVFQPDFYQVLPGVDLQVPIGLGYGVAGRSAVVQLSPEWGGDFSVGLNFEVKKAWKAGLSLTHYFGEKGTAPMPAANPATAAYASYKQYYRDRDFIALTVQSTF